ncbi:unnamed protein product [Rangifer tarandus platyrhynchus]|uniref:Uncharacterized protein n=2 Tax=Rangifer tarandus platyrhynchus TaxID=3082113 RepID=A0ABN8ZVJ6_RANTA|nr:unnamed protein product [Rangifer tarandus platyrhynchus]CAI9711712.1 unnamed protein product [Rangifer tarandus platyrhynchus]
MGTGGEAECRRKPGTLWAALLFASTTRTDVPQPRPQHQAYAVWFPALRGPHRHPCSQATSAESARAPGHQRQSQPPPGRQPQGRPHRARGVGGEPRVPRREAGEEGRSATASGPLAGLDWQRAGLRAAGARRTRKVTREVARCLAVCLQRAPPLSTRLYNLTHNWP